MGSWNMRGGFVDQTMQKFVLKRMMELEIDLLFLQKTRYDSDEYDNPYGCVVTSNCPKDSKNRSKYGTAVFCTNPLLVKELSLVHVKDDFVSIGFQGYILSGF